MDFAIPAVNLYGKETIKQCKKMEKYPDLAKELKRLSNMKVRVIVIVGEAVGMVALVLEKRLG